MCYFVFSSNSMHACQTYNTFIHNCKKFNFMCTVCDFLQESLFLLRIVAVLIRV